MTAPARAADPYQPPPPDPGMTPAQLATLLTLVQAQAALRRQITQTAVNAAVAILSVFDGWWEPRAVSAMVTRVLRVVQPAQRNAARTTAAFVARVGREMTGRPVRPVAAIDVTQLRRAITPQIARELVDGDRPVPYVILGDLDNGPSTQIDEDIELAVGDDADVLDPGEVYGRIAEQYRYQVAAEGKPEAKARQRALVRIEAAAATDVTAAVREQWRASMERLEAARYRRILHPEMSESGPCGLCVVAADRTYRVKDLQPIHKRCVCEVLPVIGDMDPGIQLNYDDLDRVYQAAGGTGGDVIKNGRRHSLGLKNLRVALTENAELGPYLVDADQHHRGPVEVAKTKLPDQRERLEHQLEQLDVNYAAMSRRRAAGDDSVERAMRWHANRIEELQRQLAALT